MSQILLLESDKLLAGNLSQVLETAGHKVDWARDPQSAIDLADKHQPDVVITELILAGRSGVEFLNEFQSYPEWQRIPVIIYSEVPVEQFSHNASFAQLGVYAYHHKPQASLSELVGTVSSIATPAAV